MLPVIDDSEWPLVRVTYPAVIALDELDEFGRQFEAIFIKRGPMFTVSDISALRLTSTTPLHRKKVAEGVDAMVSKGALIGEAVILRNPMLRAVYHGYTWLRTQKTHPIRVFEDWAAAEDWARRLLRSGELARGVRRQAPPAPPR